MQEGLDPGSEAVGGRALWTRQSRSCYTRSGSTSPTAGLDRLVDDGFSLFRVPGAGKRGLAAGKIEPAYGMEPSRFGGHGRIGADPDALSRAGPCTST